MKRAAIHFFLLYLVWLGYFPLSLRAQDGDVFDRTIRLTKGRGTIYTLLGEVSDRSGYLFIYDSRLIENEQKIRIKTGSYTLREAIQTIVQNPEIDMRVVGKHILLYKPEVKDKSIVTLSLENKIEPAAKADSFFTIEGILRDKLTEEVLPFASIGLTDIPVGTISNQNGEFRFRVPDSLRHAQLYISYLGYETQEIACTFLANGYHQIQLIPKVIPIQEIIVRISNPHLMLENMLNHREDNYTSQPVYHTSFYREGVEFKNRLANLTEAVMRVYKSPFHTGNDQVKMLKMRNIVNKNETDTLVTRFKSGINACLLLDLVKNLPDFLQLGNDNPYSYIHSDITTIDNHLANVISFEQHKSLTDPLFKGNIYIDNENHALLAVRFEVNPEYVEKAANMYITRKSKNLQITPQKIAYSITYKQWNGIYYVNHIRGDLHFKVKKKGKLFSSAPVHIWFEMVNCATDTTNVDRFARNETISTHSIFADTQYVYDDSFWDNFNIIPPEEQLTDAIYKLSAKIEETGY